MPNVDAAARRNALANAQKKEALRRELLRQAKTGEPLNISAAATAAGVSRSLYYRHPELRSEFIEVAEEERRRAELGLSTQHSQTTLSLTTAVAQLESQIDALKKDSRWLLTRLAELKSLDSDHYSSIDIRSYLEAESDEECPQCIAKGQELAQVKELLEDAESELRIERGKVIELEQDL